VYTRATGREFPQDPGQQLRLAIEAVFHSWNSPRAQRYRAYAGIADGLGTAVVVQAMVFGNLDHHSGTGVAFTRDPASGAPGAYGDFLVHAQGEDVVAGEEDPADLDECRVVAPEAHAALCEAMPRLERAYADLCDIEFTVERGRLWVLQARPGQRTALASVRIALDLVDEGLIDLDEAMKRIPPSALIRVRDPILDPGAPRSLLGRGLGASPGAAVGRVALSAQAAEELARQGHDPVLVRTYTSPDDIAGFVAARGIVTARGGRTSHAAVVARGMDRPAVCGVQGLSVDDRAAVFATRTISEGEEISIDGALGEVYAGALPLLEPSQDARVHALLERCDARRRLPVFAMEGPAPWADSALSAEGTARCRSVEELIAALDDDQVQRVLLDPAGAADPAGLLREAGAAGDAGVDLLLLVDQQWPASLRSLPRVPWKGIVAGERGDWAARLLAAVINTGAAA
jgi:pyruvate,orthophosphate dikinase